MAEIPEEEFVYEDRSQLPAIMPIFPLPNVVLLPSASLPLFIFEDRYKEMIHDCLDADRYLSVALLRQGWEQQSGPPRPYPIAGFGCGSLSLCRVAQTRVGGPDCCSHPCLSNATER